jgi:hypothetical protein
MKKSFKKVKTQNPVAKFAVRFNKSSVIESKKSYRRNKKHKGNNHE